VWDCSRETGADLRDLADRACASWDFILRFGGIIFLAGKLAFWRMRGTRVCADVRSCNALAASTILQNQCQRARHHTM
jgi:hypothetical protein